MNLEINIDILQKAAGRNVNVPLQDYKEIVYVVGLKDSKELNGCRARIRKKLEKDGYEVNVMISEGLTKNVTIKGENIIKQI